MSKRFSEGASPHQNIVKKVFIALPVFDPAHLWRLNQLSKGFIRDDLAIIYLHRGALCSLAHGAAVNRLDGVSRSCVPQRKYRLKNPSHTAHCESTRRKEHGILQAWLFNGKVTECCALCGEIFHVNALVTAHKKKRALCTTAERLDPNIVMPVCAFGCDFLYERGYIYVEAGKVQVNAVKQSHTTEYQRALMLNGKTVSKEWLNGKPGYFPKPD